VKLLLNASDALGSVFEITVMRIRGSSNGLLKDASAAAPLSVQHFRLQAC
jgi:hypothetical protein